MLAHTRTPHTYNVSLQVVIANQLDTRKRMVVLVSANDEKVIDMSDTELSQGQEIEKKIVEDIVKQHGQFIAL